MASTSTTPSPIGPLGDAGKTRTLRSVLRVVILFLIAAASVSSRLFSVIRK